jgi:AbrB family looped-hinge helix DNA binding protein
MNVVNRIDMVSFSVKGQVVIPSRLRKEFEIEEGTRACVQSTPQGILIKPLTAKHIRNLRGSLKGSKAMAVFMRERKKERAL